MDQEDRISSFTPSISAIISGVVADAKNLLISELTLTKLELQREIAKAKAVAIMIAVGVGLRIHRRDSPGFHGSPHTSDLHPCAAVGLFRHCRWRAGAVRCARDDVGKNQKQERYSIAAFPGRDEKGLHSMTTDSEQLDREIDQARRRIAAAQMAIAEKLEIVEKQVRDTVAGAQSAIDDVVTNVKGTDFGHHGFLKRSFRRALSNAPASMAGLRQRRIGRLSARRSRRVKTRASKGNRFDARRSLSSSITARAHKRSAEPV